MDSTNQTEVVLDLEGRDELKTLCDLSIGLLVRDVWNLVLTQFCVGDSLEEISITGHFSNLIFSYIRADRLNNTVARCVTISW